LGHGDERAVLTVHDADIPDRQGADGRIHRNGGRTEDVAFRLRNGIGPNLQLAGILLITHIENLLCA
jgi:hypothetical protein